jgi:hypothetical protein
VVHPSELSGNPNNSHFVAKQKELEKEIYFSYKVSLSFLEMFFNMRFFFNSVKSYDMGSTALLPLRRKAFCRFLSSLKIHCLRPASNSRKFDPIASTLTTRPLRATLQNVTACFSCNTPYFNLSNYGLSE